MSKLIRIDSCSDCIHCCYGTWDMFCKMAEHKGNQECVPYRSPGEHNGRKYPNGFFPIPDWCPLVEASCIVDEDKRIKEEKDKLFKEADEHPKKGRCWECRFHINQDCHCPYFPDIPCKFEQKVEEGDNNGKL